MDRKELSEDVQDINARLTHLEDATLDIRELMIKLIKQGNQIVQFLKGVDDITDDYLNETSYKMDNKKVKEMKALVDEYLDKQQDLVEFEKEMKKHKDKLTLNIKGES